VKYRLVVAPSAVRQLAEELPEKAAWACYAFVTSPLLEEPRRVGAPLHGKFEGLFRARRGDYRVRYRIDDEAGAVIVLDVSHRRDAYR
jgi:mRNA interferase RelE/StbE